MGRTTSPTGAPWRDVPEKYGNWNSIYRRFRRWSACGVWESMAIALAETMAESGHYSIDRFCLCSTNLRNVVAGLWLPLMSGGGHIAMSRAAYLRQQAATALRMAEESTDPGTKRQMQMMAAEYLMLAESMERDEAHAQQQNKDQPERD